MQDSFDFSSSEMSRKLVLDDDVSYMTYSEDFQSTIDNVLKMRVKVASNKLDGVMGVPIYSLPESLQMILIKKGINAKNPNKAEVNYIHDYLKANFPIFLVQPSKVMKFGNVANAKPVGV